MFYIPKEDIEKLLELDDGKLVIDPKSGYIWFIPTRVKLIDFKLLKYIQTYDIFNRWYDVDVGK